VYGMGDGSAWLDSKGRLTPREKVTQSVRSGKTFQNHESLSFRDILS
jgi:hypothetical protein